MISVSYRGQTPFPLRKKLVKKLDIDPDELPKQYDAWVNQALKQGTLRRNAVWTSGLAAGSEVFILVRALCPMRYAL